MFFVESRFPGSLSTFCTDQVRSLLTPLLSKRLAIIGTLRLTETFNLHQTSKGLQLRAPRLLRFSAPLFAFLASPLVAQQTPLSLNENVVFVDAAHGGTDPGAHLGGSVEEKDITLALAARLRAALAAKGFSVVLTRDTDATLTSEQRANLANHARPLVCILLHASTSGAGAALAVSTLQPDSEQRPAIPWATAQASYVLESLAFRDSVSAALSSAGIKSAPLRASVPPIDSLTCAALTLEVAGTHITDDAYQQHLADAVTQSVLAWKAQVAPPKPPPSTPAPRPPAPGAQP